MVKAAKGSRKGKKAWRANISTADIESHPQKSKRSSDALWEDDNDDEIDACLSFSSPLFFLPFSLFPSVTKSNHLN
jgi:hypothetical protein